MMRTLHRSQPGPVCLHHRLGGAPGDIRMDFDSVEEALNWVGNQTEENAYVEYTRLTADGRVVLEGDQLRDEIRARRAAYLVWENLRHDKGLHDLGLTPGKIFWTDTEAQFSVEGYGPMSPFPVTKDALRSGRVQELVTAVARHFVHELGWRNRQ